ncbi:hypothetical protein TNCV_3502901 [Trichonephila clavipes]|uniref:Uncharacterized protein n=1 Tax=Trichonephila clavipes TaxID=2585209 RepID=A0A8X6VCG8_TRICX|nr:hypothetical protein TNCV_3502901 [Trichonephila clavipes]
MGSRTRGRPPTRWIDDIENDLKTLNIKNWQRVAAYRWNWRKRAVEAAKTCNRWRAVGWMEMGLSQADAARRLNVSRSVVQRLWDQYQSEDSVSRRPVQADHELQHLQKTVF